MAKYSTVDQAADEIIRRCQGRIKLGIPLGLGKPNQLVNALYQKIKNNPDHSLIIYTALSLGRPKINNEGDLQGRFLKPFVERVFADYEELEYLEALARNQLPSNIQVHEFFVQPAAFLNNTYVQQNYLSSNYTHVARDLNALGVNVIAQLVAEQQGQYSLSCNPEVTLDLLPLLQTRKVAGETILCVGQVHRDLPFMPNSAQVTADQFDLLIDDVNSHKTLMSTPNMPVGMAEHVIGLYASALIKDGGTLQIGIGALGDAITHSVLLRNQQNTLYREMLEAFSRKRFAALIDRLGGVGEFEQGLYGCSEMLTYGLLKLFQEHIIARTVVDGAGREICLHGGFFLGPQVLYKALNDLNAGQRSKIDMTPISFVNHLHGDEALKRAQRQQARFINTAFTVTLLGAVVSDQLEDGRVLSGVGGQYNFVAQAHELEDARSIILLRATRETASGVQSNLVWNYSHTTVPRHLRDMVVTEYGIADLRNKTDSEVIAALLSITDSRFQQDLLQQAKQAGKISVNYQIPDGFTSNYPDRLQTVFESYRNVLPEFPLGCDFTETEQDLLKALAWLKQETGSKTGLLRGMVRSFLLGADSSHARLCLERMALFDARSLREKINRRLLLLALSQTA